jgi:primosomal protein N' (replication factor Y)
MGVLRPAGLPGSQKLSEAVASLLDRHGYTVDRIPVLDSDLVNSDADARDVLERFRSMEHPALVATSMVFTHRYGLRFSTVVVPTADALMTSPDYRSGERFITRLEKLADLGPKRMVIQAFDEDGLSSLAPSRSWDRYLTDELRHRKDLSWPPFARIALLSYRHRDRSAATRAAAACADILLRASKRYDIPGIRILGPSPALIERVGERWMQRIVIKCNGPSSRLHELLAFVPPDWTVDVDPRTIA